MVFQVNFFAAASTAVMQSDYLASDLTKSIKLMEGDYRKWIESIP
jgi:hypothetical protein